MDSDEETTYDLFGGDNTTPAVPIRSDPPHPVDGDILPPLERESKPK